MSYPYKTKVDNKLYTDMVLSHKAEIIKARIIFIHGSDSFQKDKCLKQIFEVLKLPINDNIQTYLYFGEDYTNKSQMNEIIDSLNTLSFDMSERIVTIKNIEEIVKVSKGSEQKGKKSDTTIDRLLNYIINPNYSTKLILISDKYDGRLNVYKTIVDNSFTLETRQMTYQSDLVKWLANYLNENQISMEQQARELFTTIVEPDAYIAYNELQKLQIYIDESRNITRKDVLECTVSSKAFTIFDLIDSIGYLEKEKSLRISENMLANNESLIMIISMLTNFFLSLLQIKSKQQMGESRDSYLKEIHKYFHEKYIKFLSNYNRERIFKALHLLYICDSRAKLTMASDLVLLTDLVCGIMKS
jgi:DNA polymerase-3 subunit delta